MCDILTEQLQHYTVLWRETSALYEEWAKRHALSYYELLVILSIMNPDGRVFRKTSAPTGSCQNRRLTPS